MTAHRQPPLAEVLELAKRQLDEAADNSVERILGEGFEYLDDELYNRNIDLADRDRLISRQQRELFRYQDKIAELESRLAAFEALLSVKELTSSRRIFAEVQAELADEPTIRIAGASR